MHAIALGTKVRDTVSGWNGIATARYEYMNGCERYEVSGVNKDCQPEGFTFDWQQLEVEVTTEHPGGQTTEWVAATVLADQVARTSTTDLSSWVVPLVGALAPGGPRDNRPVQR